MAKLSPVDMWRWNVLMGNLTTLLLIVYAIFWVNTLVKIWHAEFQDPRERIYWFLFVLILSPVGIPVYLTLNKSRKERKRNTEKKEKQGTLDSDKARELARLLDIEKKRRPLIRGIR
jgi:hypothetical protein